MKIIVINTTKIQTNTYIVLNGKSAFVVDPGDDSDKILAIAGENGAIIEAVLVTHAHFDHIGGVAGLQKAGATVFMHKDEVPKITSYKSLAFTMKNSIEKFTPDITLVGGENLLVAGMTVSVIHTPGHSCGGLCFRVEDKIFVGDTLFFMSYGRTDFDDGDSKTIKNSILNKIFNLQGDFLLLPGHGESTTLEFERKNNMILNMK